MTSPEPSGTAAERITRDILAVAHALCDGPDGEDWLIALRRAPEAIEVIEEFGYVVLPRQMVDHLEREAGLDSEEGIRSKSSDTIALLAARPTRLWLESRYPEELDFFMEDISAYADRLEVALRERDREIATRNVGRSVDDSTVDHLRAVLCDAEAERDAMQRRAETAEADWQDAEARCARLTAALEQIARDRVLDLPGTFIARATLAEESAHAHCVAEFGWCTGDMS